MAKKNKHSNHHNSHNRNHRGHQNSHHNAAGKDKRPASSAPSLSVSVSNGNTGKPVDPETLKAAAITDAILEAYKIPTTHNTDAVEEAERVVKLTHTSHIRKDLTKIPFVTIDGEKTRDFDDAVFAEPDTNPNNPGGYAIKVAIADVAFYVRPGSALDKQAQSRGFSVYPPDRAVHMLPPALSEHACSLNPDVERYAIVANIRIDATGNVIDSNYTRATIASRARLTYTGVDAFLAGDQSAVPAASHGLVSVLDDVYKILREKSLTRGKLSLNFNKLACAIDDDGHVAGFKSEQSRDGSHAIIEELMCLTNNVVAADIMKHGRFPVVTRIHEDPTPEQVEAAGKVLSEIGLHKKGGWTAQDINALLDNPAHAARATTIRFALTRLINRGKYAVNEEGHFGLGLTHYCHFTSPIRRYPDLQVHRALISTFNLGPGGMDNDVNVKALFEQVADINTVDERADSVYRIAMDRYAAAYLFRQGPVVNATITDIKEPGILRLEFPGTPLRVIVNKSFVPSDEYTLNMRKRQLRGLNGDTIGINDNIPVRITAYDPAQGTLSLAMAGHGPVNKGPKLTPKM